MALVVATFSAHVENNLFLEAGTLWDDSDPLVRKHPDWFSDDLSELMRSSVAPVEQATAAPGERRSTPRKKK